MTRYVYVAGPYTRGDVEHNVRTAIAAGNRLLDAGYTPFIPHLTHYWEALHPHHYEAWMQYDFQWLSKCEALVRLPGDSPGADREVEYAEANGIPVYYGVDALLRHGLQVVFLSLSGSGKTTTVDKLMATGDYRRGITCTTRRRREGEPADAYDYLTKLGYWWQTLIGNMAERTVYAGNRTRYGILRRRIVEARNSDKPTLWVLNHEGLQWMRREFGENKVKAIFLWAPKSVLEERMQARGDKTEDIAKRLAAYNQEMHWGMTYADHEVDITDLYPSEVAAIVRKLIEQ